MLGSCGKRFRGSASQQLLGCQLLGSQFGLFRRDSSIVPGIYIGGWISGFCHRNGCSEGLRLQGAGRTCKLGIVGPPSRPLCSGAPERAPKAAVRRFVPLILHPACLRNRWSLICWLRYQESIMRAHRLSRGLTDGPQRFKARCRAWT